MNPSTPSIARVRYWIVVGLRLAAAALVVFAAVQGVWVLGPAARFELAERAPTGSHLSIAPILVDLAFGPVITLLGAFAAVRWGPALARWIAPVPKSGCPECGYAATQGMERCPECGVALSAR